MRRILNWLKYPVKCAWCGAVIGECEVENSHGICQKCKKKILDEFS